MSHILNCWLITWSTIFINSINSILRYWGFKSIFKKNHFLSWCIVSWTSFKPTRHNKATTHAQCVILLWCADKKAATYFCFYEALGSCHCWPVSPVCVLPYLSYLLISYSKLGSILFKELKYQLQLLLSFAFEYWRRF